MLDYEARKPKYDESYYDVCWRHGRSVYYLGLGVLFVVIALWFGPNYIIFGRHRRPIPSDYLPLVQSRLSPVIASIKAYQRDYGGLPPTGVHASDLFPDLPDADLAVIQPSGQIEFHGLGLQGITYDLTPASEGWTISGPFVSGRIPAPLVAPTPATQPATSP